MERNATIFEIIGFFLSCTTISVIAGGIFSVCRRSVSIAPARITVPLPIDRVEEKKIILLPPSASSLRRDRIKRHVRFMMKRDSMEHRQRSLENHG